MGSPAAFFFSSKSGNIVQILIALGAPALNVQVFGTVQTMAHKKADDKEHYKWPLKPIVTIERDGKTHKAMLSCGHVYTWRGSSAFKPGINTVQGSKKRRCQECYVAAQQRIDSDLKSVRDS